MVKIRLRRIGTKGRPYYRVVVAPSAAGRNGHFVENIGTYDPVSKPKTINIKEDRAIHWLMQGAQPSETTAYLLSKTGILDKFFALRPAAKANYSFLDKRTAAMSVASSIDAQAAAVAEAPAPAPAPQAVVEEPVVEAAPEAPVAEEAAAPEAAAETPAEETAATTEEVSS